jgi:hypothetical protein
MRQVRMEALKMAIDIVPERTSPTQVCLVSEVLVKYMVEGPEFLQELLKAEIEPTEPVPEPESRKQRRKRKTVN